MLVLHQDWSRFSFHNWLLWLWVPAYAGTTTVMTVLQNKPAQVGILGEVADVLLNILRIDQDGFAVAVRRGKGNFVQHALHNGLQATRADILDRRIDGNRDVGERVDRTAGDVERHALGLHQRDILLDQ